MTIMRRNGRAPWWAFATRARFWIGLAVSALWLAMMTVLALRESNRLGSSLRQMGITPEVILVSWTDDDQFLWIEQQGRRIGATRSSFMLRSQPAAARPGAARELPGYRMNTRTQPAWRLLGLNVPLEVATRVELNPSFEVESFQGLIKMAGRQVLLQAFVEGPQLYYRCRVEGAPGAGNAWSAALSAPLGGSGAMLGDLDRCGQMPLSEPIFLSDAVIPVLIRGETLKPGQRWQTRASNLLEGVMQSQVIVSVDQKEDLMLDGRKEPAWRLTERVGDVASTVWYSPQGVILRRDLGDAPGAALGSGWRLVQADHVVAAREYPALAQDEAFAPLDRSWIRTHVDPALRGKRLEELLPQLPRL